MRNDFESNYLAHHGILGMKWGIRRYQNPDGSYTSLKRRNRRLKMRNDFESNYLAHHGILGQRWGKKNGPPYPLDAEDHSQSEKKAGYKKSIMGSISKRAELKKRKKQIYKSINSPEESNGKEVAKLDEELRKEVENSKEFKDYKNASDNLYKINEQLQKEHPGAQLLVPKDVKEEYEALGNALNQKVADTITNNAGRYAVAKLKDMNLSDFSDEEVEYARKLIIKLRKI